MNSLAKKPTTSQEWYDSITDIMLNRYFIILDEMSKKHKSIKQLSGYWVYIYYHVEEALTHIEFDD
jgi:hypothetical protein